MSDDNDHDHPHGQPLRELIATVTGQDASALSPDDDLVEKLGLDSLAALRETIQVSHSRR